MYATAINNLNEVDVSMPYTGILNLNVTGTNNIIINNPFVTASTPVSVIPDSITISVTNPGQITLSGVGPSTYTVFVGVPNDSRDNGYSQ